MAFDKLKNITAQDMKQFIETNFSGDKLAEEKAAFKKAAFIGDNYQHLKAVRYFAKKYMPELLEKKGKKSETFKDW